MMKSDPRSGATSFPPGTPGPEVVSPRSDQRSRTYVDDRVQLDCVRCNTPLAVMHVEEQ